ncbi:hypothetical protein FOZ63_025387, partial [Perkinsus olseni]
AVRSSALAHLTGGALGHAGGTPPSQNATAMHDFLSSMVEEPLAGPSDGPPARGSSTSSSTG